MMEYKQLGELLTLLEEYRPGVPETVVQHYLDQVGFTSSDPCVVRMIALAAHSFLSNVTQDTMQYHRIRAENSASNRNTASSATNTTPYHVLAMEDLATSLEEYGVHMTNPEYYTNV